MASVDSGTDLVEESVWNAAEAALRSAGIYSEDPRWGGGGIRGGKSGNVVPLGWADGEPYAGAVIAAPWVVCYWLFWRKDRPPTNDTEPEPVDPASSVPR